MRLSFKNKRPNPGTGWAEGAHGVANLSNPTPDDDATYLAGAFVSFAERQGGAPFLAQLSFHNCHSAPSLELEASE